MRKVFSRVGISLLLIGILAACSSKETATTADQADVEYDLLYSLPEEALSYDEQVRPVLESRCVVCHGCYDAPWIERRRARH